MVQAVAEVPEAEAAGKIKGVYDDIKVTLRTPVVAPVFRALAVHPDYLQVAWAGLKPNAQTVFFETRADQLRAFATQSLPAGAAPPSTPDTARPAVDMYHYLNPKLLLAIAALRSAANGQQPRLTELTRDEKRQIAPGVPKGEEPPALIDPASASGPVADLFGQIECLLPGLPVPDEYRAFAQWPEYLRNTWQTVQGLMATPDYSRLEQRLRRMAEETVVALPYRMDINPHVLRQSGLSEQDLDDVHRILNTFYRFLPGLVVSTALLSKA